VKTRSQGDFLYRINNLQNIFPESISSHDEEKKGKERKRKEKKRKEKKRK